MYVGNDAAYGYANKAGQAGEPQKREPELSAALTNLAKAFEFAERSLRELHSQMDGKVIRPSVPEKTEACTQNDPCPSTFYAQEISGYAYRAHRLGEFAQDMLRRLEV